jgi:branched-subunit amino acid permease
MATRMPEPATNSNLSQHIMPTSATMVGVCITLIGIVRLLESHASISTIIDDVTAVAAVLFLLSTLLSFASLRAATPGPERYADVAFLLGLVMLVVCGFMLAWEVGQAPVSGSPVG